jgi:RimJ/RimL family protein N-acetyltransferase
MLLETPRLRLVPFSPQHWLALIEGAAAFRAVFGLPAAEGLRDLFVSGEVSPEWLAKLREATEADAWMHGFAVVHKESESVIGTIGFKGPPNEDGMVEIAYGIAPGFQKQGYATEAAAAGVEFAFGRELVRVVRAHTLPEANASTQVLKKCGFAFLGEAVEPEDGTVWRWEKRRD